MSAIFFISFTIWSSGALLERPCSRVFHASPSFHLCFFLSFSLFLFHVRYVRNLAVANSCTNVNAGQDGFTNCFSLPPPTANPFYAFFSLLFLVPSFLSFSFSFSSPHLRIRSHEPYRGNSTFVFVFRRHRWLDWQSRKNRQDEGNGGREKFRKVKMREICTYLRSFY